MPLETCLCQWFWGCQKDALNCYTKVGCSDIYVLCPAEVMERCQQINGAHEQIFLFCPSSLLTRIKFYIRGEMTSRFWGFTPPPLGLYMFCECTHEEVKVNRGLKRGGKELRDSSGSSTWSLW